VYHQWPRALASLAAMRLYRIGPDTVTRNAATTACGNAGEWQQAAQQLRQLRAEGGEPDLISYSALLAAAGHSQQWELALTGCSEMATLGFLADAATLGAAIYACLGAGRWAFGLWLLAGGGAPGQLVQFPPSRSDGPEVDLDSCGLLLAECEQRGLGGSESDLMLGMSDVLPAMPSILRQALQAMVQLKSLLGPSSLGNKVATLEYAVLTRVGCLELFRLERSHLCGSFLSSRAAATTHAEVTVRAPMTIGDIDHREYFSPDLLDQLQKAFNKYDVSGDGSLQLTEVFQMFKKLGKKVTEVQLNEVMSQIDVDGSGEIDFEELCLLEIKMSRVRPCASLIDYRNYLSERQIRKLEQLFVQHDPTATKLDTSYINGESVQTMVEGFENHPGIEEIEDVLDEIDPLNTNCITFDKFCAAWAVLTHSRRLINYREYLDSDDVLAYRDLFTRCNKTGGGSMNRKELNDCLKQQGMVLAKKQLKELFEDFDADCSGGVDFEEFCIMMMRLRCLRQTREINRVTCTCAELWTKESFSVKELQRSGFGLDDFRRVGIPVGKIYKEGEFTGLELRRAGYSAVELRRGGLPAAELRHCGFSLGDLRNAGFSAALLQETDRALRGSLSTGDLTMLPQRCPKPALTKMGSCLSSAGFQMMKATPGGTSAWQPSHRLLTPMIREHTDWRPRFHQDGQAAGTDMLDTFMSEAAISHAGSTTRSRISKRCRDTFILPQEVDMRETVESSGPFTMASIKTDQMADIPEGRWPENGFTWLQMTVHWDVMTVPGFAQVSVHYKLIPPATRIFRAVTGRLIDLSLSRSEGAEALVAMSSAKPASQEALPPALPRPGDKAESTKAASVRKKTFRKRLLDLASEHEGLEARNVDLVKENERLKEKVATLSEELQRLEAARAVAEADGQAAQDVAKELAYQLRQVQKAQLSET
ncbi:unnamed protein product, partial [Polarella glacialis]